MTPQPQNQRPEEPTGAQQGAVFGAGNSADNTWLRFHNDPRWDPMSIPRGSAPPLVPGKPPATPPWLSPEHSPGWVFWHAGTCWEALAFPAFSYFSPLPCKAFAAKTCPEARGAWASLCSTPPSPHVLLPWGKKGKIAWDCMGSNA